MGEKHHGRELQRAPVILAILGTLVAVLAYLPTLAGGFFSDDIVYITGNRALQEVPLSRMLDLFTMRTNPYEFLPVRDLSYRLDMAVFGLTPWGYHVHNLFLFALACGAAWLCADGLLKLLARRPGGEAFADSGRRRWACAVVTLIFALHPAHVESVAWVAGRKDLLSGLLVMLALVAFLRGVDRRPLRWPWVVTSWLLFTLALMSKATVLPLAGLTFFLFALGAGSLRTQWPRMLAACGPFMVIGLLWLRLALAVGGETHIRATEFGRAVLYETSIVQLPLRILGYLAGITVAPVRLRLVYDVWQPGWIGPAATTLGVVVVSLGVWGGVQAWRRGSAAGLGAAIFLLFCLPFLQLIPFSTWSLASERFLYVPVLGLGLALAPLLAGLGERRRPVALALLALVGFGLTGWQASRWVPRENLIRDTARRSPHHDAAQMLLVNQVLIPASDEIAAMSAVERIRDPLARSLYTHYLQATAALRSGRLEDALGHGTAMENLVAAGAKAEILLLMGRLASLRGDEVEAARRYHQAAVRSRTAAGLVQARQALAELRARHADQLATLRTAASARPDDPVAVGTLANLEMELFLLEDAEGHFRQILKSRSDHPVARYNLGLTLLRQGRSSEARRELHLAIAAGMDSATAWNNLAIAAKETGRLEEAVDAFQRSLARNPANCDAAINLARLHLALGQLDGAEERFQGVRGGRCGEGIEDLALIYLEQVENLR